MYKMSRKSSARAGVPGQEGCRERVAPPSARCRGPGHRRLSHASSVSHRMCDALGGPWSFRRSPVQCAAPSAWAGTGLDWQPREEDRGVCVKNPPRQLCALAATDAEIIFS